MVVKIAIRIVGSYDLTILLCQNDPDRCRIDVITGSQVGSCRIAWDRVGSYGIVGGIASRIVDFMIFHLIFNMYHFNFNFNFFFNRK
ncbi:unnamed protein product [Camellia sinensis]